MSAQARAGPAGAGARHQSLVRVPAGKGGVDLLGPARTGPDLRARASFTEELVGRDRLRPPQHVLASPRSCSLGGLSLPPARVESVDDLVLVP